MATKRIAYVDFMKCLCIMLIVMYHIDHDFFDCLAPNLNNALQAFRLPMYYFISGLFFKRYAGFADFTRRKVNNILVPFVFFVLLAFACAWVEKGVRCLLGAQPLNVSLAMLIEPFTQRYWQPTAPLWFLLSLFWVNILFYALRRWLPVWGMLLAVLALAGVGWTMACRQMQLPLMLDTAPVALPYFVLGWGVNRLGMLAPRQSIDRWGVLVLAIVAVPIYVFSSSINLHAQVVPSFVMLYLLPFVAILALLWACKSLPRIPVLCHYGRYSLIILGTHPLLYIPVRFLLMRNGLEPGIALTLLVFVIVMALEWPVIWLLKTYAPRFTAQQPFFTEGWKLPLKLPK